MVLKNRGTGVHTETGGEGLGLGPGKASLGVNLSDAGILQSSFASKIGRSLWPHVFISFTAPTGRCHPWLVPTASPA